MLKSAKKTESRVGRPALLRTAQVTTAQRSRSPSPLPVKERKTSTKTVPSPRIVPPPAKTVPSPRIVPPPAKTVPSPRIVPPSLKEGPSPRSPRLIIPKKAAPVPIRVPSPRAARVPSPRGVPSPRAVPVPVRVPSPRAVPVPVRGVPSPRTTAKPATPTPKKVIPTSTKKAEVNKLLDENRENVLHLAKLERKKSRRLSHVTNYNDEIEDLVAKGKEKSSSVVDLREKVDKKLRSIEKLTGKIEELQRKISATEKKIDSALGSPKSSLKVSGVPSDEEILSDKISSLEEIIDTETDPNKVRDAKRELDEAIRELEQIEGMSDINRERKEIHTSLKQASSLEDTNEEKLRTMSYFYSNKIRDAQRMIDEAKRANNKSAIKTLERNIEDLSEKKAVIDSLIEHGETGKISKKSSLEEKIASREEEVRESVEQLSDIREVAEQIIENADQVASLNQQKKDLSRSSSSSPRAQSREKEEIKALDKEIARITNENANLAASIPLPTSIKEIIEDIEENIQELEESTDRLSEEKPRSRESEKANERLEELRSQYEELHQSMGEEFLKTLNEINPYGSSRVSGRSSGKSPSSSGRSSGKESGRSSGKESGRSSGKSSSSYRSSSGSSEKSPSSYRSSGGRLELPLRRISGPGLGGKSIPPIPKPRLEGKLAPLSEKGPWYRKIQKASILPRKVTERKYYPRKGIPVKYDVVDEVAALIDLAVMKSQLSCPTLKVFNECSDEKISPNLLKKYGDLTTFEIFSVYMGEEIDEVREYIRSLSSCDNQEFMEEMSDRQYHYSYGMYSRNDKKSFIAATRELSRQANKDIEKGTSTFQLPEYEQGLVDGIIQCAMDDRPTNMVNLANNLYGSGSIIPREKIENTAWMPYHCRVPGTIFGEDPCDDLSSPMSMLPQYQDAEKRLMAVASKMRENHVKDNSIQKIEDEVAIKLMGNRLTRTIDAVVNDNFYKDILGEIIAENDNILKKEDSQFIGLELGENLKKGVPEVINKFDNGEDLEARRQDEDKGRLVIVTPLLSTHHNKAYYYALYQTLSQ